jgi:methanogenic corrinoid protein MtbC1
VNQEDSATSIDAPRLPRVDPGRVRVGADAITPEVLAGFLADGDEGVVRWALGLALAARPRAEVYDTLVREAMEIVGERWSNGRWTISEEHLASQTLLRALAAYAPTETPTDRIAPLAVLADVEGEEHAIGLALLDHVLRETGYSVANLGQSVPRDDLLRFAAKTEPVLIALSASHAERLPALEETVRQLRALPHKPRVIVGGRIAPDLDLPAIRGDWTGTTLSEAARYAASVLEART